MACIRFHYSSNSLLYYTHLLGPPTLNDIHQILTLSQRISDGGRQSSTSSSGSPLRRRLPLRRTRDAQRRLLGCGEYAQVDLVVAALHMRRT
jgi:hypothetical protein